MDHPTTDQIYGQLLALVALNSAILSSLPMAQRGELQRVLPIAFESARKKRVEPHCSPAAQEAFDQAAAALTLLV